jgi:hypothetical protein
MNGFRAIGNKTPIEFMKSIGWLGNTFAKDASAIAFPDAGVFVSPAAIA